MVLKIAFNSTLHSKTAVEDDIDKSRYIEDVSNGSRGRISTQRMAGENRPLLNKPFGTHVLESGLLGDDESNLSELSGKKKTGRIAKSVAGSAVVDISKERECLNITLLAQSVICHIHILLTESLTFLPPK